MKTIDELLLLVDAYADAAAEWATSGCHSDHARAAVVAALDGMARDALRIENAALLANNKDCLDHYNELRDELAALRGEK